MTNIKIGSDCEKQVINILRGNGFWCYLTPRTATGQPVDIIAAKSKNNCDIVYLFDVKHVRDETVSFTLERIEANQWSSLGYARNFANLERLGFAIYFERNKTLYWLPFTKALELKEKGIKSINLKSLGKFEEEINENNNK